MQIGDVAVERAIFVVLAAQFFFYALQIAGERIVFGADLAKRMFDRSALFLKLPVFRFHTVNCGVGGFEIAL